MRPAPVLLGSLLGFFLIETLVFHTGFYASILYPDSSAGGVEALLGNEKRRIAGDRKQVLAIGDSRMQGFLPRYANELKPETGYTFATIALGGTTPRVWYYMLRDVDPSRRRYAAILLPVEDYDDAETWEDHANRATDLYYLIPLLRWSDLWEFSRSYRGASLRWDAARGILLKGFIYKTDFQDFLRNPVARVRYAGLVRRESAGWYYGYVGVPGDVAGVAIDWKARTVTAPSNFTPAQTRQFQIHFLDIPPPPSGRRSAYLKYWFGKIYDLYRGSGTRIIIIRLPRGPFVRPDQPPFNPRSSVRELAARPGVILDREHFFDSLERPELFQDPAHFNARGSAEFSPMLARRVRQLLDGVPKP